MKVVRDSDARFKIQYTPWPAWAFGSVCGVVGLVVILAALGLSEFVFSSLGFAAILVLVGAGLVYFGRIYTADFRMGAGEVVLRRLGLLERSQRDIPLREIAGLKTKMAMEETPTQRCDLYLTFPEDDDRTAEKLGAVEYLTEDDETRKYVVSRIREFIEAHRTDGEEQRSSTGPRASAGAEPEAAGADDASESSVSAGTGAFDSVESGDGGDEEFPGVDKWIGEDD